MDTEFENVVADSLRWRAEAVTIPPGLTGMASRECRRRRQRQFAFRAALCTGTAVVTAAAVVATIGTGARQALPARTTAYVISRTEEALAANASRSIQYVRASSSSNTSVVISPVPSAGFTFLEQLHTTDWYYGSTSRTAAYGANGKLVYDLGVTNRTSRTTTLALLDYPDKTWQQFILHEEGHGSAPSQRCAPAWPGLSNFTPSAGWSWANQVRNALGCGLYAAAGRQIVDGVDAIKLTATAKNGLAGFVRDTIWVNPSTYLPVRILVITKGPRTWLQYDFRWLPPSSANLAKLRVRIPAGFRREGPPQEIKVNPGGKDHRMIVGIGVSG
jgi:hypothetical protein